MTAVATGVVHTVPTDMRRALISDKAAFTKWASLTPLARNEWICWTISVKKEETRNDHIKRLTVELRQGKRRPCCWIGCIHRTDKAISPAIKGILAKRAVRSSG